MHIDRKLFLLLLVKRVLTNFIKSVADYHFADCRYLTFDCSLFLVAISDLHFLV